jgi:hypothetical protein
MSYAYIHKNNASYHLSISSSTHKWVGLSRAGNRCSERAALNVRARKVPVLRTSSIVTLARQTKNTQMPIGTVARCARRERSSSFGERAAASGVPKGNLVGREVDLVSNVVPLVCLELRLPLALAADHPLKVGVRGTGFAIDPAVLELREVALKEGDLVLVRGAWDVRGTPLDREVVEDGALVDGCLGLRDELGAPHVLGRQSAIASSVCVPWVLTEFHLAVLSIVILAPCFEPVSAEFLNDGERLTYLETAPDPWM